MKTLKLVIISAIVLGSLFWLWPNQPNPVSEQTKKEFGAANSQAFDPLDPGSVTDSVVQDQIVNNAAQPPNPSPPNILFTSDHLSLDASNHPLQVIVNKIAQQSGITIVMSEAMPNPPTTIQFRDLPIEQGLHRLFENYDIFFFYTRNNSKPARLAKVWVYPQGQGQKLAPIPSPIAARAELIQDTTDTDSVKRASAIANLVEQQGSTVTEIVQNALTDSDERVRIEALHAALQAQIDLPLETLKDLVQHDASAKIRSIALAGLVNRSEEGAIEPSDVLETLIVAQKDTDPEVSELAAQLMKSLDETSAEPGNQEPQEQSTVSQSEWIPQDAK